jgi:hypothetical protein
MTPASGRPPVREFLSRASSRERALAGDGLSGATCERITVGGTTYFVKRFSPSSDWVMRVAGDHVHRSYLVWQAGIMDRAPECIDHTVVAMDLNGTADDAELTIVMRDVGDFLVPPGDTVAPPGQHAGFVAHMAALASAFWGWADDIGLTTMAQRLRLFAPGTIAAELTAGQVPSVLAAAGAGWPALAERSPLLSDLALHVHDHPEILTFPLQQMPGTFVHGDWKMGNLGSHLGGRTILLDWTLPGAGPACWDLCWYLALNRARLPESKEEVITRYRDELENNGIATGGWWQEQLDLCLIGVMATFGWEKALGDAAELSWWESTVTGAAARQHITVPGAER